MSVGGFYDAFGRPMVECSTAIRASRTRTQFRFLIDTGADRTVLMPEEARTLGFLLDGRATHVLGSGFGGSSVGVREWASIGLTEPDLGEYRFLVEVDIPFGPSTLPSVLGRDILDRCRLVYDPSNGVLDLEVWRSDDFVPA